ncbi:acyl-phosphate glycerol 3-phosphate acyltransferase [Aerococcus urinaehominis]|uniref:Acyl-phosphate glycerol 3-phosphate acyltransferase n=1 Tax=Aerococcus urinaehominis TaxID=128944 RepID=A0A0X8FK85_9LACT|nr:lysophospholipid acyltransferase family protein [Aerococcus urinaehominis]AMB98837.1 acyl-phosphate glycerol 3-phosphate acyltransferase [Aerococcus urinaehominis]SDM17747.1 1-acyl-sn-glycerol-3-phosphate acyltransferase [Aerococcus urinaehominis]
MYNFLIYLVKGLLFLVNGPTHFEYHPDYDANQQYLVISPHRTILDPPMIALALLPHKISYMAKKELFKPAFVAWLLKKVHVIPVDRQAPAMETLKTSVNVLKKTDRHLGIFPTGSRYSTKIKPGAVNLAKMGQVNLLPAVYQGPLEISGLFSWKQANRARVRIGKPIILPDKKRLTKTEISDLEAQIAQAFVETDKALNPDYHYDMEAALAKRDRKYKRK